jgi:hypothetical protein
LLETGRSPTGPQQAFGPVVNGPSTVANTSYDLSGVAALQTSVNPTLANMQSGATVFADSSPFTANLGAGTVTTNIRTVVALFSAMTASFDLLNL